MSVQNHTPGPGASNEHLLPEEVPSRKKFESLGGQFGVFVIIATFSVTLIVTFLAFARDVILGGDDPSNKDTFMFDVGLLLSFIAAGCHFGIIIVAGRAHALCHRMGAHEPKNPAGEKFWKTVEKTDFASYVKYCERLLLGGTLILIATMLFMSFWCFSRLVYPLILTAVSGVLVFTVFLHGYWGVSLSREQLLYMAGALSGAVEKLFHGVMPVRANVKQHETGASPV